MRPGKVLTGRARVGDPQQCANTEPFPLGAKSLCFAELLRVTDPRSGANRQS